MVIEDIVDPNDRKETLEILPQKNVHSMEDIEVGQLVVSTIDDHMEVRNGPVDMTRVEIEIPTITEEIIETHQIVRNAAVDIVPRVIVGKLKVAMISHKWIFR